MITFNDWWMDRQPEHPYTDSLLEEVWTASANLEREECAVLCEELDEECADNLNNSAGVGCLICADAIRDRTKKKNHD